ncbi:unnamed protein product [Arctia plantaginis]|uniref:Uncharacterized protein n=1 Tax=Arctia plantaginis TaxID=874455 RepID=A0A8S0YSE6_ARCPL|nr:unnamed protein product [Arctia plantaginis]
MWFIESCRYNRVEAEALLKAPVASARDKRRRRPTQQIIAPLSSENSGVREQGDVRYREPQEGAGVEFSSGPFVSDRTSREGSRRGPKGWEDREDPHPTPLNSSALAALARDSTDVLALNY